MQSDADIVNAVLNGDKELFADWKTCLVIRLSGSNFDCTKTADIDHLANQIKCYVACPSVIASEARNLQE